MASVSFYRFSHPRSKFKHFVILMILMRLFRVMGHVNMDFCCCSRKN